MGPYFLLGSSRPPVRADGSSTRVERISLRPGPSAALVLSLLSADRRLWRDQHSVATSRRAPALFEQVKARDVSPHERVAAAGVHRDLERTRAKRRRGARDPPGRPSSPAEPQCKACLAVYRMWWGGMPRRSPSATDRDWSLRGGAESGPPPPSNSSAMNASVDIMACGLELHARQTRVRARCTAVRVFQDYSSPPRTRANPLRCMSR